MNSNNENSSDLTNLKINITPSSLLVNPNPNPQKEIKSLEKEQKFFNEIFPKIFTEKNNKIKKVSENSISRLDKKIKGISLSVQTYNKYMVKYQNLLKYPSSNYYSTEKLKNFIPFNMLKNTNLNKKKNFYSTFNDFGKINQQLNINFDNSNNNKNNKNNNILNQKQFISRTNYGNKDIWRYHEKKNETIDDNEILKYFIEGTFLFEPERIKFLKINEKAFIPHMLNKKDYEFYSDYLENLHKNENFTDIKSKEYETSLFKKIKLKFLLELRSISLNFEEIDIKNMEDININNNNYYKDNKDINNKDNKNIKKNIQQIYLPFKYIPLFFLLDYISLKTFISEIISFDIENNKFYVKVNEKLEATVKKYSEYVQNKISMYTLDNNETAFKDIIYYQNEFHFNYIYPWIIYDNRTNYNIAKFYKLKIILPTINFQPEEYGIRFQKYATKWLILELIKRNFIFWDRYLLYNLFMNKKFRNTISYILNKKRNYISYEYTTKTVGPTIDDKIAKKNYFEFFVTEVLKGQNHFYYFTPYKATISSRYHNKYDINDTINLKLNDSKKIYNLAKYFGLIGTFNKCMFYNKLTKKYYFTFKFLQDITQEYILLLKGDLTTGCVINKKYKQVFKYNGNEYHIIIRECLLCEKTIMNSYSQLKYYKIPNELVNYIFEKDINSDEIFSIFINISNKIIDVEEKEEYTEYFMKRYNNNDSSSSISKKSIDKNKRKIKNGSSVSLRKVENKKDSEKNNDNKVIIKLTNNSDEYNKNSNKKSSKKMRLNTIINRNISDLKDGLCAKNKKEPKKQGFKSRSNTKIINILDVNNINNNKINIENINKEKEKENNFENRKIFNINNKNQFELMRIKRNMRFPSYNY